MRRVSNTPKFPSKFPDVQQDLNEANSEKLVNTIQDSQI